MINFVIKPGFFRLFLASVVFLHHLSSFAIGGMAVLVFFVLSGYWITKMYNEKYTLKKNAYFAFVISRVLRLFPIFLVASMIHYSTLEFLNIDTKLYLSSLPNYIMLGNNLIESRLVGPAWSLDIELQYYLLFPFIYLLIKKYNKFLLFISGIFLLYQIINDDSFFGKNILTFFIYFLIGATFYIYNLSINNKFALISIFLFITVIIFLVFNDSNMNLIFGGRNPSIFFSEYNYMTNHFLALLLIPFALFTVKNTTSRLDRFFGDCSYSIYLIHWTVATIANTLFADLFFEKRLIYTASLVILSYLLCSILTLTIDKYFNNLRNKIHHKIN